MGAARLVKEEGQFVYRVEHHAQLSGQIFGGHKTLALAAKHHPLKPREALLQVGVLGLERSILDHQFLVVVQRNGLNVCVLHLTNVPAPAMPASTFSQRRTARFCGYRRFFLKKIFPKRRFQQHRPQNGG